MPSDGPAPDPQWAVGFGLWVLRTRSEEGLALLRSWARQDPHGWSAAYARAVALLPDRDAGEVRAALEAVPADAADAATDVLHAQVLLRAGDREAVRQVLRTDRVPAREAWALRADLANPFLDGGAGQDVAAWLHLLGEPFRAAGLEPPALDDSLTGPDGTPFSWLRSRPEGPAVGSDVVTVVVSAYRPDEDLLMAVRSLTDQSWQALEILVVDDASGPAADPMLERAAALDPRVEVVRAPRNAGTYAARNLALARATGRWVTFHDYDDWAHPRRVEHQVAALGGPAIAGRSGCLRAYPDLSLTYPGYPAARQNASSLLLERETATDLVGGFHLVRKSADMEYPGRLRAARRGAVRDLPVSTPLAITQLRHGSLSRSDAVPGWTRWNRIAYRDQYREWHRRIASGTASPYLPVRHDRGSPRGMQPPTRAFSALGDVGPRPGTALDVVLVADLRSDHVTLRRVAAELSTLAAHGLAVGVAHADPPIRPAATTSTLSRGIARLVNDGVVRWADPDDPVAVGTVLVLDPPALLLRRPFPVRWTVGRTMLCLRAADDLVADVPAGAGGPDPHAQVRAAEAAFDAPVSWRAVTAEGLRLAERHDLAGPGLVPWLVGPAGLPRRAATDGRPRVGHGVLDRHVWDVPPPVLRQTFGDGLDLDVRFATEARRARGALGEAPPAGWLFLDEVGAPADLGFAGTLDVVVVPRVGPDGVAAAREALAAGVPVVLADGDRPAVEAEDPAVAAAALWTDTPLDAAALAEVAATGDRTSDLFATLVADRLASLVPDQTGG